MGRSSTVEQILDMSALEKLEPRRGKKANGEDAVGDRKERVEVEPGVWATRVVKAGESPTQTPPDVLDEQHKKDTLREYLNGNKEVKPKNNRRICPDAIWRTRMAYKQGYGMSFLWQGGEVGHYF